MQIRSEEDERGRGSECRSGQKREDERGRGLEC